MTSLVIALALGLIVPWVFMRMLVPTLAQSERSRTVNFRGRPVAYGLGIVWLVWGIGAMLGGFAVMLTADFTSLSLLIAAGLLAVVAFGFGLIDDAYGSSDARGFKGHVGAMLNGRLTTGGLKLLGIGSAALAAAFYVANVASWGQGAQRFWAAPVAGAAIALTANFLNLMDLRPGRALKVYSLLSLAGWCCISFVWVPFATNGLSQGEFSRVVDGVALVLFLAGPVIAIWSDDLGEVGMLGDAGANPMGVVAGFLLVASLPLVGVITYAIVMFALNLASERVSFSRLIETAPPLAWFDRLGRADHPPQPEDSPKDAPHETHGRSRIEHGDQEAQDEGETGLT